MNTSQAILTRVKPELKAKLIELARADRRSLSAFLAMALEQLVETK